EPNCGYRTRLENTQARTYQKLKQRNFIDRKLAIKLLTFQSRDQEAIGLRQEWQRRWRQEHRDELVRQIKETNKMNYESERAKKLYIKRTKLKKRRDQDGDTDQVGHQDKGKGKEDRNEEHMSREKDVYTSRLDSGYEEKWNTDRPSHRSAKIK